MTQIQLPPEQAWTFARLPELLAQLGLEARQVCHVGAHHGEEVPVYTKCGFKRIVLVEPDPDQVEYLRTRFKGRDEIEIIAAACGRFPGRATLYRSTRTVWSGLTPSTDTTATVEVDTVLLPDIQGDANVLVIDTQGTELIVLNTADLVAVELVIIETTRRNYDTAALYDEVILHMNVRGFVLVEEWVHDDSGYTDCVFARA